MVDPNFHYEEHEMTLEEVEAELENFERLYGMTSEEFHEKWKKGDTEWVAESVAWSGFFKAYKSLKGKNGNSLDESKEATVSNDPDFYIEERDMTLEEIKEALERYERKYGMASKEFYEKLKRGETYWVAESVDWSGLFRAYRVLNGQNNNRSQG